MSIPCITPAEVCQSEVQLDPLSHPTAVEAIKAFKRIVQTSIGHKGKLKIIGSSAGGHITLTSSSVRLLQNVSVRNTFLRFIVSSAKTHLASCGDNGLLCAFLASHILDTSLNLPYPKTVVSELLEHFARLYLDYLTSRRAPCVTEIDFSDTSYLLTIIRNILSSKPACALSQNQNQHLSILLLKAFLNSVPDSPPVCAEKLSYVTFSTLEGTSAEGCCLYGGLLIRCPEITGDVSLGEMKPSGALKLALFTVSLAGDVSFPSTHLEVSGTDIWKVVLDHLRMLVSRLVNDGVQIVACQKVVHPILIKQLEDKKILVIERLGLDGTGHLKYVSGAVPISSLSLSSKLTYGYITGFETIRMGKKQYFLLKNKERPLQTVLLCSYNEESLNETKVVSKQVLDTLYQLLQNPKVCYGGGCTEIHVASVLEKMVKEDIAAVAEETGCYPSQVLAVLENFISCITEVAVTINQGHQLGFATDAIHHHLWKLEGEDFPSSGASCMCGSYRAEDFMPSQWKMIGKQISASPFFCDSSETCFLHHAAHKPKLLDELSTRVNAFKVAFETSSLLMSINLCILNKN